MFNYPEKVLAAIRGASLQRKLCQERVLLIQTERLPEREIDAHYIFYIHTHASGYKNYIHIYLHNIYMYIYHTHIYIYTYQIRGLSKLMSKEAPSTNNSEKTIFQQFYDIAQKMTAKIHGFPTETNQFGELLEILLNSPLVILT